MFPLNRRTVLMAGAAAALGGCIDPARATEAGDPAADAELRALVVRLADRSRASRPFLLRRFNTRRLTPQGRILYEAVLPGAETDAALALLPLYGGDVLPYPVTHRNGAYRRAGATDENPRELARQISRETARLEAAGERGVIAPDFVLDAASAAVAAVAARLPEDAHADLSEALARQGEALTRQRAAAGPEPGVWRLPNGEEFYALALSYHYGAPIDPLEAHAAARARARALQAEADAALRAYGLAEGDVGARLRTLARLPDQQFSPGEAGKTEAIALMQTTLERARTLIAPAFEAVSPAEVRALPAPYEANGAGGRRIGATYYADLGAPRARWTLASVIHHELLPGHIQQAPYEREAAAPALQTRYCNGYSEGWATYAEQLADELGAFADDPLGRIGYLQWMLFRLGRVIVDTGMHALRWSRAEAYEEMRALQGEAIAFVSIEEDLARMAAQPGFAAAQGLAALAIADLRERTRASARSHFDLAGFHAAMLRHGPLSPPGLEAAARAAFGFA